MGPGGPALDLNERQGAQPCFMNLCSLLGVPTPSGDCIFEQDALVLGAARGYADLFKRDHFAGENTAPGKNLDAAVRPEGNPEVATVMKVIKAPQLKPGTLPTQV